MTLTIGVLPVLAALVFVLCRYAGLRLWHALICVMLGFYLASSNLADEISRITDGLFSLL